MCNRLLFPDYIYEIHCGQRDNVTGVFGRADRALVFPPVLGDLGVGGGGYHRGIPGGAITRLPGAAFIFTVTDMP